MKKSFYDAVMCSNCDKILSTPEKYHEHLCRAGRKIKKGWR